ncbi:MAG: hypothetical protein HYS60_02105 [Candidatus Wildermuthbacteria bacterium]|nr:hypothetical protein [Candidatus Wildermuthbacteria bacterium]
MATETTTQADLQELWMLLFQSPGDLDDVQIKRLLGAKEVLYDFLVRRHQQFPGYLVMIQRYRARKRELGELPTERLQELQEEIRKQRKSFYSSKNEEDIGDSFFESPPIDSDEHILYELLRERGK